MSLVRARHRVAGSHRITGLVLTDHEFDLPLQHAKPDGEKLTIFAREVAAAEHEHDDLPWLVFLQGGPGFAAPRPTRRDGWLGLAVQSHRVLLLDQRGTGRSSPVDARSLARLPRVGARVDYLRHFRADAIVRDCELIRKSLLGERKWTILGQSFGGFCALSYLSLHPEGLASVIITGGIPPIGVSIDDVYRATYPRVSARNRLYYRRYPGDQELVHRIVAHLESHEVRLPNGDRLTARRLQQLGMQFGFDDGFEVVHYLLEQAFTAGPNGSELSYGFLQGLDTVLPFSASPLFSLIHEAIYCEGTASRWSAHRIRDEFPEFGIDASRPVFFTGEMIYPWLFEEYGQLRPLADVAQALADRDDWEPLYDRDTLARNEVPSVAALYADDMYVDRAFSERVAGGVGNLRVWITNQYEHNGVRSHGEAVFGHLLAMLQGRA